MSLWEMAPNGFLSPSRRPGRSTAKTLIDGRITFAATATLLNELPPTGQSSTSRSGTSTSRRHTPIQLLHSGDAGDAGGAPGA